MKGGREAFWGWECERAIRRIWSLEWDPDASMRSGKGTRQTKHNDTQKEISKATQNQRKIIIKKNNQRSVWSGLWNVEGTEKGRRKIEDIL